VNALRVLFCYLVVAVVGFCVMEPWGFIVLPVAVTAVGELKARYDAARLESLRQATVAAQAEDLAAQERYGEASARLALAWARRNQVLVHMRRDGWYVAGEVVSLN